MANTLMFEVGIKSAQEQLDKIKQEFTKANGELSKLLNIKVSIDGVDAVTKALSQIGDTSALRSLRSEITALNREFSILSKGAGGSGDIAGRGLAADIEKTSQSIDRYTSKIKQLTEERTRLVGGTRNSSYQNYTDEILRYEESLEGARRKLAQLNEQKNQPVASEPLKKSTQDAQAFETALGRIETAIGGLKSGMSVNLTGDFTRWAEEVQNVTASVRELVEQFKQLHQVQGQGGAIKSQTEQLFEQAKLIDSINSQLNKLYIKGTKIPNQLTPVDDAEMKRLESERTTAQAKFNELLSQGATVANSYAQTIQQLGQKYNHTTEQAQKLTSLISGGELNQSEVMRKLGIGFNQAKDVVETINALQKLKQEESKSAPQGGIFDPQKMLNLHDAIDKVINEINRMANAFAGIGKIEGIEAMKTSINGLQVEVGNLVSSLTKINGAMHIDKSAEEIAAYEAKIKSLKDQVTSLETTLKQASEGIKTVASGKGSEATQNQNLDTLNTQLKKAQENLAKMEGEYKRLDDAGAQNAGLKARIDILKQYIEHLEKVKTMDLSKAGALKANDVKFNEQMLFGQLNKQMYSDKAVKEFSKIVDETLKGKAAADALNDAFERMRQKMLGVGTAGTGGMRGVSSMMESITTVGERNIQTLIKEEARINRLIEMAKKSILFGEGHDVAGMQGLRVQQRANLEYLTNLQKAIHQILENRSLPEVMRFLNTPGQLSIPLPGRDNDIALLGAHYNILTQSVTGTTQAMRQLNKEMQLDNLTKGNKDWNTNKLTLGLENVKTQIDNIKAAWAKVGDGADMGLTRSVAQMMNGLNDLKTKITSSMSDDSLLGSRRGYMQVLNADYEILLRNAKDLTSELNKQSAEREKAEAKQLREAEKFTEQSKKAYAQAEKEKEKAAQERAKAVAAAEKQVQAEITKTESLQKKLEQSITRGEAAKRDMSGLYAQNAALENQVRLMESLKNSISRGRIDPNSDIIGKRIKDTQVLREDTELLRKAEEKLNAAREQANRRNDNQQLKNLKDEEKSVNDAWIQYNRLGIKINELIDIRKRGVAAKMDVSDVEKYINRLRDLRTILKELIDNSGRTKDSNLLRSLGLDKGLLTSQLLSSNKVKIEDLWDEKGLKKFITSLTETEKQSQKADANIRKLGMAFNDLKAYMSKNGGSEEMKRLQTEIQGAIQKMRQLMNAGDYAGAVKVFERISGVIKQATTATKEYERSKKGATTATTELAAEEKRLADAIRSSTKEMRGQSQVLSDLKMMATQYLSVWGAQSFLRNIIEIGGQLEKQRLSIGAILQDMAHGEDLFDKIKRLAVQSPFGVVELDQFTKQLSAYGFKYNELYDMTKRLADISAGAGTEVSRLALALGHVRAEGALSGYTLRQFAMNNIPMVSELAKKLSEVEGHLVTTADVRKRVSNKEIGYKDVEDVIKKLTNEGGMFYRMQEVISESVQARFKNLRDSFDIMYGEIAKSSIGDILKDIASVLTRMSREWKSFIPIIQASGVAFAAYRLALLATNMTMGKNTASTLKNILAQKQKIAADLQQVSVYKTLNSAEKQIIANQNALTASDLRAAMSSGAMTKAEALKLVALRKLTIQEAAAAVNMGLFSEAEVMAARNSSLLVTRIKLLGTTLKTSLLSALTMVFNAWTVLFAALAAGMSMYQKQEQYNEDRKARNEELWLRSREGQKNLREMTATYKVGLSAELNDDGLKQAISDLKEKLKDYAPDVNKIFNEAFAVDTSGKYRKNVKSLAEQYEILAKALENTERAYTRLTTVRYAVDDAVEATQVKDSIFGVEFNNPFDNNVVENIKKYAEAFGEADKAMMAFMRDYHDEVQRGLAAAGMRFLSTDIEGMEEAVKKLRIDDISDASMWSKFNRSIENNEGAKEAFESYKKSMAELREQWNATSNDIMTMGNRLFKNLTTRWGSDISKWTTDQKMAVYMVFDDIIGKEMEAAGVTEEEQKKMRSLFMEPFGIEFRTETEAAYEEINELKEYLESITDKAWVIKLKVESSDSVDIIDQARKLRKAAKEGVEELGKDLKKAGLGDAIGKDGSVELGKAKTPAEERMLKDYSKKVQEKLNAEKTLDAYHAAYEDEKKKKDKGRSSGEDKEAKKLREIAKLYKDAYNWYKKYEKQVGEGGALTKVKEQFQPLFDQFNKEWGTNLRIDSIPLYRQNLEDLLSKAQAYYETPAHRNNYMVDAIKEFRDAISDVDYSEAERKMDKFASDMTRQLDELTRKWEIFNSVRESTGDDALAKRLTGITPGATPADIKRLGISQMVSVPIDFDEVLKKSDEQIDEYVEGLGLAQDQLKGVKEKLKDWKKAQEDVEKNDIINYAKWLGSLVDLQSIRNRNQGEYNRILEETNRLLKEGQITPEEADRRRKAAQDQRDYKDWTATAIYSDLYNNAQVMAKVDFDEAFAVEMEHLKAQFKNGTITLQEYSDKVAKLNQIASEFSSRGFLGIHGGLGAFLAGGTQGLSTYYRQKAAQAYKRGDDEEGDKYEKMAKSLEKQQKAAEQVVKAFQDLAAGADLLGNLFSSMGWEGGANAMSDASGILNGAVSGASSLSFLGPYGMAAGAALGVVGGIFALHDKSLQRQIDALKENNAAIEANTDAIKKARERTLGYDAGQLRKAIANIYNNMGDSDAKNAMREYYMTNGSGTGYRQELANLKAERENYIEMYNLEADKKNESSEALMEYKQKIAELDDQIAYFAEDLSNELFSIDLKGWASQIGDALMTAFENGEDAAEAFKDTVKDIMRSVLNNMLTIGILEPMMENLRKKLFGENGKGGVFDATNPEGTIDAAMQEITAFFGEGGEGQQMIQATETFYKRWQEFMRSKGLTLDDESSSSASGSIKSITEQTADLLASYVNATRASTAKIEYLSAQYFPMYFAALTSGNASLRNIENQTAAIMRSNDVIADKITSLDNNINGLKNKTWKVPIA